MVLSTLRMSSRSLGLLTLEAVDSSADMLSSPPTPVSAHQFALSKQVTLHGAQQFRLGRVRLQRQFGVECVQLEVIAMQFSLWRAWPAVADPFDDVNFVHCDEELGVFLGQNSALEVELVVELLRCLGSRKSGFVL